MQPMASPSVVIDDLLQPELTELHRLPARPPLEPHPTVDAARAVEPSTWRRSLDGTWQFRLVDRVPLANGNTLYTFEGTSPMSTKAFEFRGHITVLK